MDQQTASCQWLMYMPEIHINKTDAHQRNGRPGLQLLANTYRTGLPLRLGQLGIPH